MCRPLVAAPFPHGTAMRKHADRRERSSHYGSKFQERSERWSDQCGLLERHLQLCEAGPSEVVRAGHWKFRGQRIAAPPCLACHHPPPTPPMPRGVGPQIICVRIDLAQGVDPLPPKLSRRQIVFIECIYKYEFGAYILGLLENGLLVKSLRFLHAVDRLRDSVRVEIMHASEQTEQQSALAAGNEIRRAINHVDVEIPRTNQRYRAGRNHREGAVDSRPRSIGDDLIQLRAI